MSSRSAAPGARLRALWKLLSPLPGGRWLFSRALGWMVPYSGRLGATVTLLEPGHVRVELRERRAVRNHLGSIHAVALVNLGELAGGLAVLGALPATVRGIVTGLETTFSKKARGRVAAEARCAIPSPLTASTPVAVEATVRDGSGQIVARVVAHWLLGPVPSDRDADPGAPR